MTPIWSEEAEMSVLGAMLVGAVAPCVALLKPEHFWRPAHQLLFSAMRLMHEVGTPVDMLTLKEELGKDLARCGGVEYLIAVQEYMPVAANAEHYALIVKDKAARRAVCEGAGKIVRLAREDATLGEMRALLDGLCDGSLADGPMLTSLADIKPSGRRGGIPTGFKRLDSVNSCGGYPVGQITTVSAYHKTGKSTWMIQAMIAAARAGYRVVFITVADLSADDVKRKVLRQLCGWEICPNFEPHKSAFVAALDEIDGWDVHVYDASDLDSGTDVETVCALLRSENAKRPIGMACIDYAQELTSSDKKATSEYAEQTICAKKLRIQSARMKETAMLVGSQITEGGKDGRDRTKSTRAWEEKPGWILRLRRDEGETTTTLQSVFSRFGGSGMQMSLGWDRERECYVQ